MSKNTYIDLFAGCGGLSLGLHNAGWKGLFAIEKSPDAFETLKHNLINKKKHFNWVPWLSEEHHDINEVLETKSEELKALRGEVDLVAGGPPCQGFSLAGLRNENDERNQLVNSYLRFIELTLPKFIFFENVTGFTIDYKPEPGKKQGSLQKESSFSKEVINRLKELGYKDTVGKILDFSNYGIPQSRKRFIIVGSLYGQANNFFDELEKLKINFVNNKGISLTTSVTDAISDLLRAHGDTESPDTKGFKAGKFGSAATKYQKLMRGVTPEGEVADSHRFVNHNKEIVERFQYYLDKKLTPAGYRQHFNLKKSSTKRLEADTATPTLTTLTDDYIHYCEPRVLTVREYARIQSFPDWYEFKGKYTTGGSHRTKEVPRYTQIGNAIPPLFGELAGIVLKNCLT